MADDKMIAALLRERVGFERANNEGRLEQIDEQLKHYGYEAPADSESPKAPAGDPKKQAPQGRSAKPQQTAKD
jgi:hypothetical protein